MQESTKLKLLRLGPICIGAAVLLALVLLFFGASFDILFYGAGSVALAGILFFGAGWIFAMWDGDLDRRSN